MTSQTRPFFVLLVLSVLSVRVTIGFRQHLFVTLGASLALVVADFELVIPDKAERAGAVEQAPADARHVGLVTVATATRLIVAVRFSLATGYALGTS